jgi:hypothetical protein
MGRHVSVRCSRHYAYGSPGDQSHLSFRCRISIDGNPPNEPFRRELPEQRVGHQDPEMQLRELREYAGRRGWQIAEEYIDQGVSGGKEFRPELNRLMSDACRRRFDAILVWKIDRFGRSLKHLVNSLAELLPWALLLSASATIST